MWCNIVEVNGHQVLFTNSFNSDEDREEIKMTIQADDFLGEDHGIGEVSLIIARENEKGPFTDEQFLSIATEEKAESIINNEVLPLLREYAGL